MRTVVTALILTVLARAAAGQTHYTVLPSDTDPAIGAASGVGQFNNAAYQLYVPQDLGQPERLVIFLHGAGAAPFGYTNFLLTAAEQGYYVIGLSYPDVGLLSSLCGGQVHLPDCYGEVHEEVWSGVNAYPGPEVQVSAHPQDSILNRLHALFDWLENPLNGHASEGWDVFRPASLVDWSRVVVAGHSAGANHAAFIASRRSVDRVLMFSGGGATTDAPDAPLRPADWVIPAVDRPTEAFRYYGLAHTDDIATCVMAVPRIEKIQRAWSVLGVPGAVRSVDYTFNYGGSHQLLTSRVPDPSGITPCERQGKAHSSVVANGFDIDPHLHSAWTYMLGTP
jgi:hypothetical protein